MSPPVLTVEALGDATPERELRLCHALEEGRILLFPRTPFDLPEEDRAFLPSQRQTDARYHKNIAYRPGQDRVTGEQTFIVARESLALPEKAPIAILERLAGARLS